MELVHRLSNKEVSNLLWNRVTHIPHNDGVVVVNARSQLQHKALLGIWFLRWGVGLWWSLDWSAIWVQSASTAGLVTLLGDDSGT